MIQPRLSPEGLQVGCARIHELATYGASGLYWLPVAQPSADVVRLKVPGLAVDWARRWFGIRSDDEHVRGLRADERATALALPSMDVPDIVSDMAIDANFGNPGAPMLTCKRWFAALVAVLRPCDEKFHKRST